SHSQRHNTRLSAAPFDEPIPPTAIVRRFAEIFRESMSMISSPPIPKPKTDPRASQKYILRASNPSEKVRVWVLAGYEYTRIY
ncbi:hypothetical protein AAMO2058_000841400, partial [Amorphochlora amoebiformis]